MGILFIANGPKLPRWLNGKESACQGRSHRRHRFDPWVRKIPCRRKWQPIPVFSPGKFKAQRSLASSSSWGHKESDSRPCTHSNTVTPTRVTVITEKRISPEISEITFANLQIGKDLYLDRCPVLSRITFPLRLHTHFGVHCQAGQLSLFPLLNRRFAQRRTILINAKGYHKKQLEGKSHTFKVKEMLISISFLLLL